MANDFYYLVTMKLQPGAAFNAETQGRGINVMIGSNADPTQRRDYSIYEPGVIGPGVLVGAKRKLKCETTHRVNGVVIDGCPSLIAMHLADQAQNQFTKETNLGTGNVIVQVYRHKITKAEHAKELRMEEIRVKGWNDERTEMKASMCKKCEDDYNMCRVSAGSKNCAWKYRMCAQPAREREMPTWEWCGTQRP